MADARARLKKRTVQIVQEAADRASGMRDVTHMGMSKSCELGSWTECRAAIERDSEEIDRGPITTADLLRVSHVVEFEGSATLASLVACLRRPEGEVELSVLLHTLIMKYIPVAVFTTANCPGNSLIIDMTNSLGDTTNLTERFDQLSREHVLHEQLKRKGGRRKKSKRVGGRPALDTTVGELVTIVHSEQIPSRSASLTTLPEPFCQKNSVGLLRYRKKSIFLQGIDWRYQNSQTNRACMSTRGPNTGQPIKKGKGGWNSRVKGRVVAGKCLSR